MPEQKAFKIVKLLDNFQITNRHNLLLDLKILFIFCILW